MSANWRTEIIPSEPDQAHTCEGKSLKRFPPRINLPSSLKFGIQTMNTIQVFVNNQAFALSKNSKLSDVLDKAAIQSQRGIAVAVNNLVVPKSEWNLHPVKNEDRVTVIRATQGG